MHWPLKIFGENLMDRIDLTDVTFMIPFRCDSQDRLENILLVLEYLTTNFNTTIMILENAQSSILDQNPTIQEIKKNYNTIGRFYYTFVQNDSETFHRTKILNDMLEDVDTEYVANYDTDVLFPVHSYVETVEALRRGEVFVFPYHGIFYEVPRRFIPEIKEKMEVSCVNLGQCGVNHPSSVGGAMFLNTNIYKRLGGECEAFVDWGYEDNFRVNLFSKMGYNIVRVGSCLYHIQHWRGKSSGPHHEAYNNNAAQYYNTVNMTSLELMNFVNSYNRFKE